jgi:hypothetical protein
MAYSRAPGTVAGQQVCRLDDLLGGHARDFGRTLGRVLHHLGLQLLKALGAFGHELLVVQFLGDQDVHDAVEQGNVGARLLADVQHRKVGNGDGARIADDDLGAALLHGLPRRMPSTGWFSVVLEPMMK